jgi:hypothetical protein
MVSDSAPRPSPADVQAAASAPPHGDPIAGTPAGATAPAARGTGLFARDSRSRRLVIAAGVYVATTLVFAAFAGPQRLTQHTPFNHYALLADAWLHGRHDLAHGAPAYAMNNDFAVFQGKTYISFPPFPALLMLPFVALAGSPEDFCDGQFAVELAGIAPAVLFLVLEKLRRSGRSPRSETENLVFAGLYAFGTVYFFTAVEGTVWFVAMVVGAALLALYTLFALDAEHPVLAGAMLACAYLTRPFIVLTAPLFAFEVLRACTRGGSVRGSSFGETARDLAARIDRAALARIASRCALFALPPLLALIGFAWFNASRFGIASPFLFGHEFLTVGWHGRIVKWGLVGYHYLAKNLGIALTSLPWLPPHTGGSLGTAPFQINDHGLALWFTTPLYLWLLWPKGLARDAERRWLVVATAVSAALPAAIDLFYQNTGWRQFGYRFSNDYSILLFVLLAIGARPMGPLFKFAAAWSVAWNAFGAFTYDKAEYARFYFTDGSQAIVYQPD